MTDAVGVAPTTAPPRVPRRRLAIDGNGTVTGDAALRQLGANLRYACRMASQIEPLLDLGPLRWVSTVGSTAVTARVTVSEGITTMLAEIDEHAVATRVPSPSVAAESPHEAIRNALRRVRDGLEVEWGAIITWDKRLVGVLLPDAVSKSAPVCAVLSEVGLRAMAVLSAFDESYRETAVVLEYARGSLIVVAIGNDVLFAFGDEIDKSLAGPVIRGVRSVLAPHSLDFVWTWGDSWAHA